jgi:F-type H+-transporting ATPase subunit epsilon
VFFDWKPFCVSGAVRLFLCQILDKRYSCGVLSVIIALEESGRIKDMAKLFELNIFTPERLFFSDKVEAVTVTLADGSATFLAGHAPLIAPVEVSTTHIKKDGGEWVEAFSSVGFVEVRHGGVIMFVQTCEWPEEIDARRAEEARLRAEEALRQKRSIAEYRKSKIDLARAVERLRVTRLKR